MQQQLLLQSEPWTHRQTQPELSAHLPEHPSPEPAGGGALLHSVVPVCGSGLYLRLGQNQNKLKPCQPEAAAERQRNYLIFAD